MQGDIMEKNFYGNPFKLFMSYVAGHKKLFAIDMGCALLVSVIDLAFPYVSRISMNSLLPNRLFAMFFTVMGIMVAAYIVKAALYYIITVVGHRMGVLIEADMRRDVFTHMQDLSCSFYDKNRTGVLMSRITSDLFEITELSHHGPENILICTLTIVGAMAVMFTIEWRLALTLSVVLPLCLWFTLSQRIRMKKANIEVKKKTADIYAAIESSISGIRTAKAFANEEQESRKFDEANAMFKGAKVEYYRTMGLFQSGMDFTCCIAQVLVITVGGLLIMQNSMDYVDLVTFSLYVSTFISPIRKLAQFSEQYMNGSAGFTRFIELMQTEPTVKDRPDAIELGSVTGRVDYDGVSFDYGNGVEVLKDIDLHIEPGKCLAVVGPSGGGKSTAGQLLARFWDVESGSIAIGGTDIRDYTARTLMDTVAFVFQDTYIFAESVYDNIAMHRDVSREAVEQAAKAARCHEFILSLPDGYNTRLGDGGHKLSGGETQRIAIARAILKDAPIVVLDEAMAFADAENELALREGMAELLQGKTVLMIAHRLYSIRDADCIYVLDSGRLVESGTHRELLDQNGLYAHLWAVQNETEAWQMKGGVSHA